MRIVFYSTKSNYFGKDSVITTQYPNNASTWDALSQQFPEHEFIVASKKAATTFFDAVKGEVTLLPQKVQYVYLEDDSPSAVADLIEGLHPDVAIAISTSGSTYDWNFLRDALTADELEKRGIHTIAQKIFTSVACFDKWRSNLLLRSGKYGVAKAVYVHNEMFWAEKTDASLYANVYKEYILYRIKEMNFPVIVKNTASSGSIGIQTAQTFDEVENILCSGQHNGDIIVEELLQGEPFGAEIHGVKGHYHVLPPFSLSTNKDGITDPYRGVKFGPVTNEAYHVKELQDTLRRMAEEFNFAGITQVDLIFSEGKWNVIEINPRWSGMTTTTSAAEGRSPFAVYTECAVGGDVDYSDPKNLKYVINFKIPEAGSDRTDEIAQFPGIKYIRKTVSEKSDGTRIVFCEVVFGGFDTKEALLEGLLSMKEKFPEAVTDYVIETVSDMVKKY